MRLIANSLQKQLLVYTSIFSLVMGCLLVFAAYRIALEEINEILDAQMQNLAERVEKFQPEPLTSHFSHTQQYHEEELFVDVWLYDQQQNPHRHPEQLLQRVKQSGFYPHKNQYGLWHTYIIPLADRQIQVSQQYSVRQHLAIELALNMFLPYLIIIPFALFALALIIVRIFRPFEQFKQELDQRQPQELHAIPIEQYPLEISPSIEAINLLFQRIRHAQQEQQQFIADAAHELRTPITALNLQTQILLNQLPEHHALTQLAQGLNRTQHLVTQLLDLAKLDNQQPHKQVQSVHLPTLIIERVEQLLPFALIKNQDLGVLENAEISYSCDQMALQSLITNLLDNAIKYTPENGVINLSSELCTNHIVISIEDSGPGIDPELYDRVLTRFYRVQQHREVGSGLGLSIVNKACERLHAGLSLEQSPSLGGLKVLVKLPLL